MLKISSFFVLLALILSFGLTSCTNRNNQAEVKKQKVGDVELAYYTKGSGDPIVLITGFKGTMSAWDPAFIDELAKHYTVVLFDNRGVGLSTDTPRNETTISQMSQDAVGLIKGLGYKKVHLFGWSMGSSIAMQLALDHPELLNTLILAAPNPGGKDQAHRQDVYAKLTSPETSKEELISLMFPESIQGKQAAQSYVQRLQKAIENGSVPNDLMISKETIKRQASALKLRGSDEHLYDMLSSIKVPTLVAGGLHDVIDLPQNTRIVANRIPYAWAAYFPDSGHGFTSQDYLQFSRLIHVFIASEMANNI